MSRINGLGFTTLLFWLIAIVFTGCGGGGSSESGPTGQLSLFAGNPGGRGNLNGTGASASFNLPGGVAADNAGNIYVADSSNSVIRKITPAGVVTTLAGAAGVRGSNDGTGAAARFNFPNDVATDSAGNIYVADTANHVIRKITPSGVVTTLAGSPGVIGSANGTGAAARFFSPNGIATDSAGNVYVADTSNSMIRIVSPAGVVGTLAGSPGVLGSADATGASASFYYPDGIATDSTGNVYVADTVNGTIRMITSGGVVTTLAGTAGVTGSTDATGAAASFNKPSDIATDSAGNIYVADTINSTVRKITSGGVVTTLAGSAGVTGSTDGNGTAARFNKPYGIATNSAGNVYVADTFSGAIRSITPAGNVTTLAGLGLVAGSADGTAGAASFNSPLGVGADSAGNVYVADTDNCTIRKITPAGAVTTLAGTPGVIGSANGNGAAASFKYPYGVAADSAGNVYVADHGNSTIRKITPAGVVTTLAGTPGVTGNANATGAAASFNQPDGIATDSAGNVYVADTLNRLIRKITPAGVVTTLAGSGTWGSADGFGAAASFKSPSGIAADASGNLYVADFLAHTIRKITPAGMVSTFAGADGVSGGTDGIGAAARFNSPSGIVADSMGNVYVADNGNNTIRKITPSGVVTTIAGQPGSLGFAPGILPGVLAFQSGYPNGLALYGNTLYTTTNNAIVQISNQP